MGLSPLRGRKRDGLEDQRDEPTLRGQGGQTGPAAAGRNNAEVNKRRQALLSQDGIEQVQIELRVYSMCAQSRFEDRSVDQEARLLADNECENALRRFNEMVVNGGRSSIRIRPASWTRNGPFSSSPDYYPDRVPMSEGSVVETIMSRVYRPAWVVPADGDTLLRQAIGVDYCFERAEHNIMLLAGWTSLLEFKGVVNPFCNYVREVLGPIRTEFQRIVQADHERSAASLPGPVLREGAPRIGGGTT